MTQYLDSTTWGTVRNTALGTVRHDAKKLLPPPDFYNAHR